MVNPPNPPYLGPAAHDSGVGNLPATRVVMHSTVSPCEPGGARNIAAYFRTEAAGGSSHYVVDPGEVVQVVWDNTIAWHAPPNAHSFGVEMCDMPSMFPGRWRDKNHKEMLRRAAHLTARLCLAYDIPIQFCTARELMLGGKGITTHRNVSLAFHQSDHWDPGYWPRHRFMRMVRHAAAGMQ